jgi:hypothetical protein
LKKLHLIYIILIGLLLTSAQSCKKLPRDNPLDKYNTEEEEEVPTPVEEEQRLEISSFTVIYDDNEDGIINPNEKVYLLLNIINNGNSTAYDVEAIVGTASMYVSNLEPYGTIPFNSGWGSGTIYSGDQEHGFSGWAPNYNDYSIKFNVSGGTPEGTKITFNVLISDEDGGTWTDSFEIDVSGTNALMNFSRFEIAYDNNDDGIVNQGEMAYLRVYIKNNGTSQANDVKASISTSSEFVYTLEPTTALDYNSVFGNNNIQPNEEEFAAYGYGPNYQDYTIKFLVAENTPDGEEITFIMNISDDEGNEWQDSFKVQVFNTNAILGFGRYEIIYEDDQNGELNPGEIGYLRVYIRNTGTSRANGVEGTIISSSEYLTSLEPGTAIGFNSSSGAAGYIPPSNEKYGQYGYAPNYTDYTCKFKILDSTPIGSIISFSLNITDAEGNVWEDSFTIEVK